MKTAFAKININAPFPCHQAGFIQQTYDVSTYHDDLYARIALFDDGEHKIAHIACDNLGLPLELQCDLNDYFKDISITISSTHTHFACSPKNQEYINYLKSRLISTIENMELKERSLTISYECIPFEEVGTSRISNNKANVLLQMLVIWEKDKPIYVFITHNCHPTIMNGDTPFFSKEYPGYALDKLNKEYPDTFFAFTQGADGDVSTRFTRKEQNYNEVMRLGSHLADQVSKLLKKDHKSIPFNTITYKSEYIDLEHEFGEIDTSNLGSDLSPREIETIRIGEKVRSELSKHLDILPKKQLISRIRFEKYNVIFCPNELFSFYIDAINIENSILVCYSNGYAHYVTGISDNFITYETFTDTFTKETKKLLFKKINEYSDN